MRGNGTWPSLVRCNQKHLYVRRHRNPSLLSCQRCLPAPATSCRPFAFDTPTSPPGCRLIAADQLADERRVGGFSELHRPRVWLDARFAERVAVARDPQPNGGGRQRPGHEEDPPLAPRDEVGDQRVGEAPVVDGDEVESATLRMGHDIAIE